MAYHPLPNTGNDDPGARIPRTYAWVVFALTFGLLLSDYMSRQVLNAVFPLLKAEWMLTDARLGLLSGVVALMVGLNAFIQRTWTGKAMRAVSTNLDAARLMGINTDRIIRYTFAVGSALAAAGGILFGLDQITINPLMGVLTGLKAFVAAVLGGIGNIRGAVLGGLLIGLAEQMTAGYLSPDYRDAITSPPPRLA